MSTDAPVSPIDDAAWPVKTRAARISMRPLTAVLTAVLIAVVALFAGARLEKRQGVSATASSGFSAAGFGARNRAGAGGAAAAGGLTTGTVTQVSKKLLYLTSSTGALVKVQLTPTTTFTRTAASPTGGLALGDTAIVRGAKNAKGVLVATSVIATAKGVTSTGGFGGFGGFGGGTGAPAGG